MKTVSPDVYTADYFLQRCGGVEFFDRYKADILKPMMQLAVKRAELEPGMKILDVGCGRGELVAHLSGRGFEVTGLDYSKDAIAVARGCFPKAQFICGDLFKCEFKEHSFDRIFFLGIIEHLYDEEIAKFFQEFRKLLKPGGLVIVTTCTNSLYFKSWTYKIRLIIARVLNSFGVKVKSPIPPRSDEDLVTHINEQNYFSLPKHFPGEFWTAHIEPRLNPKLCLAELYGKDLPPDFPLRSASSFKKGFFKILMAIPLLKLVFTRANIVLLRAR